MKRLIILLLSNLFFFAKCDAQDSSKPLKAARPDQTEGTHSVERGNLQIETGATLTHFDDGIEAFTGRLQARYGVAERAELQLVVEDGRQRDRYIEETVQSIYPVALGTRITLVEDKPGLPDIAFVGYLKLPVSSRSSEQKVYWAPTAMAAVSKEFGRQKQYELEANVGIKQDAYSRDISWLGSAALEYYPIKQLYFFGEYFAEYQSGDSPSNNIDGGVAWIVNKNFQLDIAAGTTVHAEQGNQFISAGLAYRIEKK